MRPRLQASASPINAEYHAFVGSRRKMVALREKLVAGGIAREAIDRVKAPAGLDLGAITPEEIAMSILAEITVERRRGQRAANPVAESKDPIMQMNDSQRIPAPKEKVWAALNDPEILKQCIPGCQSLEMSSPTEMTATVVFKVGPVKATFSGKVTLSDLDPPNSYRISGEGSGGVAGFAKGGARGASRSRKGLT